VWRGIAMRSDKLFRSYCAAPQPRRHPDLDQIRLDQHGLAGLREQSLRRRHLDHPTSCSPPPAARWNEGCPKGPPSAPVPAPATNRRIVEIKRHTPSAPRRSIIRADELLEVRLDSRAHGNSGSPAYRARRREREHQRRKQSQRPHPKESPPRTPADVHRWGSPTPAVPIDVQVYYGAPRWDSPFRVGATCMWLAGGEQRTSRWRPYIAWPRSTMAAPGRYRPPPAVPTSSPGSRRRRSLTGWLPGRTVLGTV
jgi:hypothetical protein